MAKNMQVMIEAPVEICTSTKPTASVIWLHGLGADGHDFAPVIDMLNLPHIRFILPHAPVQKISQYQGHEMRAWYDLFGLNSNSPQDAAGIQQSQQTIEALIANEHARGIAANRMVIAGFSQGGAMALHTALRHQNSLAGVLALSTYLPLQATLAIEKTAANQVTPIFMAHGNFDEVITLERAKASLHALQTEYYQVDWREYPMAHSVCEQEISDIAQFLALTLPQ